MSLEKFSKNLTDFIEQLNLTFPETTISVDEHFSVITEQHMETFLNEMKPHIYNISQYDDTAFRDMDNPVVILEHIQLSEYWSHNISMSTQMSIFNYLHILYIVAFHSLRSDTTATDMNTAPDLESSTPSDSEVYYTLINNIRKSKKINQNETIENSENNPLNSLLNSAGSGIIGELAEDIMGDLNLEDLGNPMDLLGMLTGGSVDNDKQNNFMNLIKKVGDKVQTKISSGELDQTKLLNEAQNLMGSMGGLGNLAGGLNIGNLTKMMSSMSGMPGMPDMSKIPNEQQLERRMNNNKDISLMRRKERLRKKLAEKKLRESEQNNTEMTEGQTSRKKRRRRKRKNRNVEETA